MTCLVFSSLYAQTDSLNIYWDPNSDPDIYRYLLQRSVNSTNNFVNLQYVFHPTTHVVDHDVLPGNSYAYRVAAIDSAGNMSGWSNVDQVGVPEIQLQLTSLITGQDTTFALSSILYDPDHTVSELQVQISQQTNVTATIQGNNLVISSNPPGYIGPASFTMQVTDPDTLYDLRAFNFQFVDNTPVVFTVDVPPPTFPEDQSFAILMDTVVTVSNFTEDQLTWNFVSGSNLQYSYDSATRVVTISSQNPNWFGQDQMIATAQAPDQTTASDTFLVTITPVNDSPVLTLQHLYISSNPDSNIIDLSQYSIDVDNPDNELDWEFWGFSHFNITWVDQAANIIQITPLDTTILETGFFRVFDPQNASDTSQVTIEVTGNTQTVFEVNIGDQQFPEDQFTEINMDTTVFHSIYPPSQITWNFTAGNNLRFTYNANSRLIKIQSKNADWFGQDIMVATATDPDNQTVTDTFQVLITPVNDPPTISVTSLYITDNPDSNIIDLTDYAVDVDNTPLDLNWTFSGFTHFSIDWVDQVNKIIRITPLDTFTTETGTFQVSDPSGASDTAQVTIHVLTGGQYVFEVNVPDATFDEDSQFQIQMDTCLQISNYPPSSISWSFEAGANLQYFYSPSNRKVTIQSAEPDWYGVDQMIAIAQAPDMTTRTDTFQVTILPINDPPQTIISNLFVSPFSNNLVDLKLYANDVDNTPLELDWEFWGYTQFTITWYDEPNKIIQITPSANATSQNGFFRVIDPLNESDTAIVNITYLTDNTPPHLKLPTNLIIAEDSSITMDLIRHVVDSTNTLTELQWQFNAGPHLVALFDPSTYKLQIYPEPDWYGTSSLQFIVTDPFGQSDQQQLEVVVQNRNDIKSFTIQKINQRQVNFDIQTELPSMVDVSYWFNTTQIITISMVTFNTHHVVNLTNLQPDTTYFFKVKVTDENGKVLSIADSSFVTGTPAGTPGLDEIVVYPNPLKPSEGHREMIFLNLPENAQKVVLYSILGEKLYEADIENPGAKEFHLNVVDNQNQYLPSGLYIYMVKSTDARVLSKGKVVIIR
ncbi:MAG: fibronectin type III domain-containing protein [Calditrichaeota bacterium]|nr:MAG: fibronectin type III domain-containing protein [Calditrichota bacterium]